MQKMQKAKRFPVRVTGGNYLKNHSLVLPVTSVIYDFEYLDSVKYRDIRLYSDVK